MERVRRRKRGGRGCGCALLLVLLALAVAAGVWCFPRGMAAWESAQRRLRLREALAQTFESQPPQAGALLVVQLETGEPLYAQGAQDPLLPASLAKLFVAGYAASLAPLESRATVTPQALALVPANSSLAYLAPGEYPLEDLLAAMLLPSGNDAAYAVADWCGGLLDPGAAPGRERVDAFLEGLGEYLAAQGYGGTVLHDPSGFDYEAATTAGDLAAVSARLLQADWFRELVALPTYTANTPGGPVAWQNTNRLLDPEGPYYHPRAAGVKTGTLEGCCNLVALYQSPQEAVLVCLLGAATDEIRYQEALRVFAALDSAFAPAPG